jgi:hypothetical protein
VKNFGDDRTRSGQRECGIGIVSHPLLLTKKVATPDAWLVVGSFVLAQI